MRRHAFTLLETMIVILIVAAISAIVLPPLAARATATRLDGAVSAIESAGSLCASRAAQRSEITALVAELWDEEWVLWAESVAPEEVGELLSPSEDIPPLPPEEMESRRTELAAFDGVELTDVLPLLEDELLGPEPIDDAGLDDTDWGDSAFAWEQERQRFMVAVFFPDGSCRPGQTLYLIGDDGRRRSVKVRPLTGRVVIRDLPTESEELEQMGGEDEEPDLPAPAMPAAGEGRP